MKWSEVKATQSCPTLYDPMDYTVHEILQARILEWVAFPFSRESSQPRDRTQVSCFAGGFFYQLSHKGSPGILEWVAYPLSSSSSWPRNRTEVSCIAGAFFTTWAIREVHYHLYMYQMHTVSTLNSCNVMCQTYSLFKREKKKKKPVQKLTANIMHKEKAEQFLAKCLWSKVNGGHHPRLIVNTILGHWWTSTSANSRQSEGAIAAMSSCCQIFISVSCWTRTLRDRGQLCSQHVCAICTKKTLSMASDSVNLWKAMLHKQVLPCLLLLLLLSCFSRVRLLVTPRTAAHQAPPSMGFSRQEYWSGVPLPSPTSLFRSRLFNESNDDSVNPLTLYSWRTVGGQKDAFLIFMSIGRNSAVCKSHLITTTVSVPCVGEIND